MRRTPTISLVAVAVAAVCAIAPATAAPALESESWFVTNMGSPCWGDAGSYLEPMWPQPDFVFGDLAVCALDPENPFWAVSPMYERIMHGVHFWAEIWLANHAVPTVPQRVDAELWVGVDGPTYRWATASAMIANGLPAMKHDFDFGYFDDFDLILLRMYLKVLYYGPAGETHVYWHHPTCPTALRVEGATVDVEARTWSRVKALYRQ